MLTNVEAYHLTAGTMDIEYARAGELGLVSVRGANPRHDGLACLHLGSKDVGILTGKRNRSTSSTSLGTIDWSTDPLKDKAKYKTSGMSFRTETSI